MGYMTMEGDTAGGLAPLAGVSKAFIMDFLRWAEKHLSHASLARVNALKPSAELQKEQYDEDELMPYEMLNRLEDIFVRQRMAPQHAMRALIKTHGIPPALAKAYVRKFLSLWQRNQWKRERMPPSFHTDSYAVSPKTWARFPILSDAKAHHKI